MAVRTGNGWLTLDGTEFQPHEFSWLWLLAVATYGVGDTVTSVALIWFSRTVHEANPLIRAAAQTFGPSGLVGLKLATFFLCIGISLQAANTDGDRLLYYGPPVVLTLLGIFVTVHNLRLLTL
ncbi:MAG: hypothetical protein ABEI77_01310 [Halorientalis sp.]